MVKKEFCRRCTLMHADEIRTRDLSGRIIGCAFRVQNMLGAGFLEKLYENALAYEFRAAGLAVAQQKLFEGDRPAAMPVVELCQATPRNPPDCPRTLSLLSPSACISVHLRQK
ncbi:MAG TPA: GxxExxY protein [Acetobacteraceae bacterium]|nr:GxxExxY protein [Acetobacteraceae bacterium]